jgi:hypothetical protein
MTIQILPSATSLIIKIVRCLLHLKKGTDKQDTLSLNPQKNYHFLTHLLLHTFDVVVGLKAVFLCIDGVPQEIFCKIYMIALALL